jgi:hypothetical protein
MKLLFVVFDYLPIGSAESNILSKLIPELQKKGHEISILTTKPDFSFNDFQIENEVKVHRFLFSKVFALKYLLNNSNMSLGFKTFAICNRITDKFISSFACGFLSSSTIQFFYKNLKKINAISNDFIIPVCGYWEIAVSAIKYLKELNSQYKMALYQLDPLVGNSNKSRHSFIKRKKLETLLSNFASIIITNQIIYIQKQENNILVKNVHCVDFPLIVDNTRLDLKNDKKREYLKIVFSGYLYPNLRNPEYTFQLISSIKKTTVKLFIIGSGSQDIINQYAKKFPNVFIYLGALTLEESFLHIKDADMLLNIGSNDKSFVPSKVFDYISTGKPIINIYKHPECPTIHYLKRYNASISVFEDRTNFDSNLSKLESFIFENQYIKIPYKSIKNTFYTATAEYVANHISETFLSVADSAIRR